MGVPNGPSGLVGSHDGSGLHGGRYPTRMPTRFAQLPLPAFIAALDAYRRTARPAERIALGRALGVLVERSAFAGAEMTIDAPPLPPVRVRTGSVPRKPPGADRGAEST